MQNLMNYIKDNNIKDTENLAVKLLEEFSIKCRVEDDGTGDKLYTFKYDQLNSPKASKIVQECRGIIFDENLNVIFKGFDRFYNLGEMLEITEQFDWDNDFDVFEKADGSLVKLYFHNGKWQVGTSSTATAEVPFNTSSWDTSEQVTFRKKIIEALGYYSEEDFQENAHMSFLPDYNYVFEYISPENRIVTPYEESGMVLLSVFDKDGVELDNNHVRYELEDMQWSSLNVRAATTYEVSSKEELLELVNSLEGLQEGFVIRDNKGMRLKIKSDLYVAAHRMRGENGLTLRNACNLVLANEHGEYLAYFPSDFDKIYKVTTALDLYLIEVADVYATVSTIEDQKDFAKAVACYPFNGLLFSMRKNGGTARNAFFNMLSSRQLSTLEGLVKNL